MKNLKTFKEHSRIIENLIDNTNLETVLDNNRDLYITVKNKETGDLVTISNYAARAEIKAINYPMVNGKWISRTELINDYDFVRSWNTDDNK